LLCLGCALLRLLDEAVVLRLRCLVALLLRLLEVTALGRELEVEGLGGLPRRLLAGGGVVQQGGGGLLRLGEKRVRLLLGGGADLLRLLLRVAAEACDLLVRCGALGGEVAGDGLAGVRGRGLRSEEHTSE